MPIDANIALGVRPMQLENPVDNYGKALSVRHMIQQSQLGAEQLKAAQTANEKNSLAIKDQELARQAWKEFPTDPDAMLKRATELGVGPDYLTALQQHVTNIRKTNSEIADKDLTVKKYQNEQLAGLTAKALQLPDDQYAAAWPQLRQSALQINPKLQLPDQPLSKADLDHFRLVFTTEGSLLSEAEEQRKKAGETRAAAGEQRAAALAPSLLSEAQSKALTAGLGTAAQQLGAATDQAGYAAVWNGLPAAIAVKFPQPAQFDPKSTPAQVRQLGMSAEQQTQTGIAAKNAENNVSEYELRLRAAKGDQSAKDALAASMGDKIRVATVEAQNKWNLQAGALAGTEGQPSELAKSVADYSVPLNQALARVPAGMREIVMQQVRKANPDFRAENYDAFRKTEMDATTGNLAKTSNSQSTAIAHMDVLNQAITALNNGDIKILNQLGNSLGVQVGKTAKTTFEAIVHKVGPELASAYLAGGGSVGERGATEKDFDPSLSPDQLKSNIAISAKLLAGKVKANQEQYNRGTYGRGKQELLTKDAATALDRLSGGGGGTISVISPEGVAGTISADKWAEAEKRGFKKK